MSTLLSSLRTSGHGERTWFYGEAIERFSSIQRIILSLSLRDNKTPLFRELEEELFQQNITKESVEASYRKYVSNLQNLPGL